MPIKNTLTGRVPVHIWSDNLETQARKQLEGLAQLPILFHHVAVMPDVHAGRGSTVGTVMATRGAIIPAAVGVDIGCGMVAAKTSLSASDLDGKRKTIRERIEEKVPVGFSQHTRPTPGAEKLNAWMHWRGLHPKIADDDRLQKKARLQCGTLGGGNHFIEICLDAAGRVWILLHSGSRNIGKTLADVHIHTAKGMVRQAMESLKDPDLAYLAQGTPEFNAYIHDLLWAQDYARHNREFMLNQIIGNFKELFGERFKTERPINCHHNYAAEETHFGRKVWITRKGAVRAGAGDLGIIPGSMGTKSYIVRGKGNAESFESCSHGAGRRMSRTQAKKTFNRHDLEKETAGVECRKDKGVVDEIPSAYKDIDEVMENQSDLVDVVAEIKQIICVKG